MRVDEEQRLCQSAPVPHAAQPTIRGEGGEGGRALAALLPTSLVCTTPRSDFHTNVRNKVSGDAEMKERESGEGRKGRKEASRPLS